MGWGKKINHSKCFAKELKPETKKKRNKNEEVIPLEGGWGWCVVAGYTLTSIFLIPIIQNFGLIYKERLLDLNMTSTDITTIISLNSAMGQILGVFQGPLLKRFGYRKMAVFGVATFTMGTMLTGLSQSFLHFIISFGIITSIGLTYTLTAFSLAMSSYFKEKRSRASGWLMGFSGFGSAGMPQLVTWSLGMYGVRQTSFLLAALNANGFVGASLLRPIHWFAAEAKALKESKKKDSSKNIVSEVQHDTENDNDTNGSRQSITNTRTRQSNTDVSHHKNTQSASDGETICDQLIEGVVITIDQRKQRIRSISESEERKMLLKHFAGGDKYRQPRIRSVSASEGNSHTEEDILNIPRPNSEHIIHFKTLKEEEFSVNSQSSSSSSLPYYSCDSELKDIQSTIDHLNRAQSKNMLASLETLDLTPSSLGLCILHQVSECDNENDDNYTPVPSDDPEFSVVDDQEPEYKGNGRERNCMFILTKVKNLFDLDLLTDRQYIIITLGLSIAIIGELLFSILTPFILAEIGFDRQETSNFMSIIAVADIASRFASPYIPKGKHSNSRFMYLVALFCLVFSRIGLLFASGQVDRVIVALFIGFSKGVRIVFWIQVLPDYVEIKKLPSAMSIQNLLNGLMILIAGPLAGKIVEINNSYLNIIYVSNALTGMTIVLWAGDYFWQIIRSKCNKGKDSTRA